MEAGKVTFTYKDYRKGGQKLEMELEAMELIGRFSMHILPKGFVRIRHYSILSGTSKKKSLPAITGQLGKGVPAGEPREMKVFNPHMCPHCKTETMRTIELIPSRGPPQNRPPKRNTPIF